MCDLDSGHLSWSIDWVIACVGTRAFVGRLSKTLVVLAVGWGSWVPCVCSVAAREPQAAHCSAHDGGGEDGLQAGPAACCCDGAALQAPPATVTRQASSGPVDAVVSSVPAQAASFTREDVRLASAAVVADSPPPRLIARRI
jgi:hypothetical protein